MVKYPAIIGIDIGSRMGYAVLGADGRRRESGTWNLGGPGRGRWIAARKKLSDLVADEQWETSAGSGTDIAVCYELVRWRMAPQAAHVFGGLTAVVEMVTFDHGLDCYSIKPSSWKKIATGSGAANKERYVKSANQRYGLSLAVNPNEDEAAALGIAYACYHELGGAPIPIPGDQLPLGGAA